MLAQLLSSGGVFRLIAAVFWIWSATASAGPRGRVIRVERTDADGRVAPRLCVMHSDAGTCLGDQPGPGQIVTMFDEQHAVAEIEIVEVTSATMNCPNLSMVKARTVRGATTSSDGIGVIDPRIDPGRARVLDKRQLPASPSGLPSDEVWQAIDRDGDGTADILITRYSCDASGKPVPGGAMYCLDIWARMGARMTRTTHFAQCLP